MPSPRRLQVEPSRDAEILTACRAAWDGPGATNALAVAATAAQTISRMIVVSARRDHSRIEPKCTARCNSLPFAALQLQPARIRTPRRVNTSRSPAAIDAKSIAARGPRGALITPGTPCHGSRPGAAEKRSFTSPEAPKWSLVNKAPRTPHSILLQTSHGPERRLARSVRLDCSRCARAAQGIAAPRGDGLQCSTCHYR